MSDTKSINWEGPSNWDGSNFWENQPINLRLKAAAPDLLAALLLALDRLYAAERERRYDHETFDSNAHDLAINKAIAAIAKATGENR